MSESAAKKKRLIDWFKANGSLQKRPSVSLQQCSVRQLIQGRMAHYAAYPGQRPLPRARVEANTREAREREAVEREAARKRRQAALDAEYNRRQVLKEAAETVGYMGSAPKEEGAVFVLRAPQ